MDPTTDTGTMTADQFLSTYYPADSSSGSDSSGSGSILSFLTGDNGLLTTTVKAIGNVGVAQAQAQAYRGQAAQIAAISAQSQIITNNNDKRNMYIAVGVFVLFILLRQTAQA